MHQHFLSRLGFWDGLHHVAANHKHQPRHKVDACCCNLQGHSLQLSMLSTELQHEQALSMIRAEVTLKGLTLESFAAAC